MITARIVLVAFWATLANGCAATHDPPLGIEADVVAVSEARASNAAAITREADSPWLPDPPLPERYDWIRLKSGEWLKGDIERMRDDEIEFDSDKLKNVDFDWEDVHELRSPHRYTYVFENRGTVIGEAVIDRQYVRIRDEGGWRTFRRDELLSIVPGNEREWDYWSVEAFAGFGLRSGNSDQVDIDTILTFEREDALSRFHGSYQGSYGRLDGKQNANVHRGRTHISLFVSRDYFVTPFSFEVFSDRFQNIAYRLSPSAGGGYRAIKKKSMEWNLALEAGYQFTEFRSAAEEDSSDTVTLIPSTEFEMDITKAVELEFDYQVMIGLTEIGDTSHHATTVLSVDIVDDVLDFDVVFTWDRIEDPAKDDDGSRPKKNDLRVTVGFSLEY
jgi:hypothetical protein